MDNGIIDHADETIPRSKTGIELYIYQANKEIEKGNLIGATKLIERAVDIREHHLDNAPYSAPMDVSNIHRMAAANLNRIVAQLNGANESLATKYQVASQHHIDRATQLLN
mmetsp:Transcript_25925/g.30552  ORF Transcript_25925/g.30552 Transcript_25925/m.30552 type:complete len:111 (+) Transcript_25925:71-403(+)|eukprot:CAMPEP_0198260332 /NCGR_PEP_ID=MMETSP1447-20131203/9331_1 /TAXON_ID=420782 /ORGANISM="Chaetoceros dichaeta, Strain CCMP1751" /LENGTH=110 /DNA_ID=CAMNT_0043947969 /DNA_START=71 /DNA_END=403 /DNA_ORIENTATION=-